MSEHVATSESTRAQAPTSPATCAPELIELAMTMLAQETLQAVGDPRAEAAMDNCVFMGRDPSAFRGHCNGKRDSC